MGAGERFGDPDRAVRRRGYRTVCGIDEVGRGPLAGPVVAAAVVLDAVGVLPGVDDSKRLSPEARAALVPSIERLAVGIGVGLCEPAEIDRLNIHHASLLAMRRAVDALPVRPDVLLVDGLHRVGVELPQEILVKGDARSEAVAAASVIAKQYRDALMIEYEARFPGYGFGAHKGYATESHRAALLALGPSPIHRRSFRGVCVSAPCARQLVLFAAGEGR